MNNRSDDPLRYAPKWARHGGHAERPDGTRWPRDPDPPGRRITDLVEEHIGRSATPDPDEDSELEWPRVPLLGDPDIDDRDGGSEPARRVHGRSLTFVHFVLSISVAGTTAFLVVVWTRTNSSTQDTSDRTADADVTEPRLQEAVERRTQGSEEQPVWSRARLAIVQTAPGTGDDAIPLGVWVVGATASASLLISGLPVGSTISAGRPSAAGNWRLPASELSSAAIRPPLGFVGAIDLTVELRLADDSVADRRSLRLTWVAPPEPAAPPPNVAAPVGAAPVATGRTPPRATPNSQATNAPLRRLDREEIATLLKRGEQFVAAGDYGSARLVLQRAAEAGDANAAFALATTYDPIQLGARRVIGVASDIALARAWYEKAKAYGSADASLRLEQLASRGR